MKSLAPTGTLLVLGVGLLALSGLSCHQGKPAAAPGPAVEKPKAEGELAFTTLAQDEVKALQIATKTIAAQPVRLLPSWKG